MMNSWRRTWRICWSVGMFTAFAVSTARSTSTVLTSRSFTATIAGRVEAADVAAGDPVKAETILQSAISSASSRARWIPATVDSMLTTTPFFRPRDSWLPMPSTSSAPSGLSRPPARSPSRCRCPGRRPGCGSPWPCVSPSSRRRAARSHSGSEGRRGAARPRRLRHAAAGDERLRIGGDKARQALLDVFGAVAAELETERRPGAAATHGAASGRWRRWPHRRALRPAAQAVRRSAGSAASTRPRCPPAGEQRQRAARSASMGAAKASPKVFTRPLSPSARTRPALRAAPRCGPARRAARRRAAPSHLLERARTAARSAAKKLPPMPSTAFRHPRRRRSSARRAPRFPSRNSGERSSSCSPA